MSLKIFSTLSVASAVVNAKDDGLAKTPPMGWMSWQWFRCTLDCESYPDSCMNEKNMVAQAKLLASEGYAAAGYDQLSIDDCYQSHKRGPNHTIVGDPVRFPSMTRLGDEFHKLKLKYGMYTDIGNQTCETFPALGDYLNPTKWYGEQIINEMSKEWKVDYLKVDGCFVTDNDLKMPEMYSNVSEYMTSAQKSGGTPMVYSCSWPAYYYYDNLQNPTKQIDLLTEYLPQIKEYCHQARVYHDIQASWEQVISIYSWFAYHQDLLSKYNGPGYWNDPDNLLIGTGVLSTSQSETQMAMWSMWAAPLFFSTDLNQVADWEKAILQNKGVIAVNQDPLGKMAKMLGVIDSTNVAKSFNVWRKELVGGDVAVAVVNFNTSSGHPSHYTFNVKEQIFPTKESASKCTDLFTGQVWTSVSSIEVSVYETGVRMLRCSQ